VTGVLPPLAKTTVSEGAAEVGTLAKSLLVKKFLTVTRIFKKL
jgi:hypothetical protein